MEPFDLGDARALARWDRLAADAQDAGIDRWCSQSPWQLAVHNAFAEPEERTRPIALAHEHGLAMFSRSRSDEGQNLLVPFDRIWGFATPILAEPGREDDVASDLADFLSADPEWKICVLTGLREDSVLDQAVIDAFGRHLPLYAGEERSRCVADLTGGIDAYLVRRTREHRRNIRQAAHRADDNGLAFAIADDDDPARTAARLHYVEAKSWKGQEGSGIESPEMARLYEQLVRDLHGRKALRCVFAQLPDAAHDDEPHDVGFILGGVLGDTYRGLQISFVEEARALSIGNLLQWHEIQRACANDLRTYDLGMDIDYKRRWAEGLHTTRTVIAVRR